MNVDLYSFSFSRGFLRNKTWIFTNSSVCQGKLTVILFCADKYKMSRERLCLCDATTEQAKGGLSSSLNVTKYLVYFHQTLTKNSVPEIIAGKFISELMKVTSHFVVECYHMRSILS